MLKVTWDVEELVALIDVYRKSNGKTSEQIEKELAALSKKLAIRAQKLGIIHDEKFRNLNGMKLMFQNVVYIATNGESGMSSASSSIRKVFKLLDACPEVFELILNEFNKRCVISEL